MYIPDNAAICSVSISDLSCVRLLAKAQMHMLTTNADQKDMQSVQAKVVRYRTITEASDQAITALLQSNDIDYINTIRSVVSV